MYVLLLPSDGTCTSYFFLRMVLGYVLLVILFGWYLWGYFFKTTSNTNNYLFKLYNNFKTITFYNHCWTFRPLAKSRTQSILLAARQQLSQSLDAAQLVTFLS